MAERTCELAARLRRPLDALDALSFRVGGRMATGDVVGSDTARLELLAILAPLRSPHYAWRPHLLAANRAILQVTANVFGAEVHRLDTEYPVALGAALRAYHADRLTIDEPVSWNTVVSGFTEPKPGHRVSPNPKLVAMYAALRKDYAMLERLHQHRAPIC